MPGHHDYSTEGGWKDSAEPVWRFRGYDLDSSAFATAMIHFYRGEVSRANVWRQRLDTTTNWAVVTTAAIITFAFGAVQPGIHSLIIFNTLLITLFLFIEARRYRHYELWSYRIRLMETDFFAAMLVPPFRPSPDWAESLAEILLHPRFPISRLEALGRRFRRNYLWLYILLGVAWILKVFLHPTPSQSWDEFFGRAALGAISGQAIMLIGVVLNGILITFGLLTAQLHEATGEVLTTPEEALNSVVPTNIDRVPWFRHGRHRQEYMAFIITNAPAEVASAIMTAMKRGVTRLEGTGMYSGDERPVLMSVATVTEISYLKQLVREVDPRGFITILPVKEVLGRGFSPLDEEKP